MAVYPNSSRLADGFLRTSRLLGRPQYNGAQDKVGAKRGMLTGLLSPAASFPDGYGAQVPLLPLKAGGMAGQASSVLTGAGSLISGLPMAGEGSLALTGAGDLSVIISMAGDGTFSITGDGGLALTLALSGDGTFSITGDGSLSLVVPVEGAGSIALSGTGDLKGRLRLEAGTESTVLTAAQIADAVWAALAAANDLPGTMGELLSTAGSGGLSPTQVTMLTELWKMRGLDPATPVTVTTDQETAGTIVLDITGDGETTSTLTRQP